MYEIWALRLPSCQLSYSSIDVSRSSWLSWLAPSASLVSILVHFTSHPVFKTTISNTLQTFVPGRKPTSASSEASVSMAEGSMPWQVGSSKGDNAGQNFKYQYHPGGDRNKSPKDAPSALNTVIVPNVTLTKVSPQVPLVGKAWRLAHNLKCGLIDWHVISRPNMKDLISGAKMDTELGFRQYRSHHQLE